MATITQVREGRSGLPTIPEKNMQYGPLSHANIGRGKGFSTYLPSSSTCYSWEQIAQHNTRDSCWVYIGNEVYDITSWLPHHPGGDKILLLCAGRDISDLFVSYHPFSTRHVDIIQKYRIGSVATTEFPQFKPDTGFYRDCRQAVGEYFRKNNINYKNPVYGLARLALFISVLVASYLTMVSSASLGIKLLCAFFFGVCQALCLLHCMHDCSHCALGSSPSTWAIIGQVCMDWIAGAYLESWLNQHTIGHHVYTNVQGADPDLPLADQGDLRRITPFQEKGTRYKYQHIYLLVLYGLLGLKFRIQDVTGTIISRTNGALRVNDLEPVSLLRQIATKIIWFIWRILVPLYVFKQSSLEYWLLFIVAELTTGYWLAFNFQVSHVSPSMLWPDIKHPLRDEWAVNQMETSLDYAHGNWFQTFLCGALNYQSIHHLFPSVSQYYYPEIAPIVMKVCDKYKVKYNYVDDFTTAFNLHVQHLKEMGNDLHQH